MSSTPHSFEVESVLSQLSLEEKASLTSGSHFWYTQPIERLGVPRIMVSDGPHGLRAQPDTGDGGDHVGLGGSLPATCFPTAAAIASSWSPALLRRIGEALAEEARAINLSVILGPGINMKRSPLCGRNFEYFSEDPFLAGELAVGIVDGIQSRGVGVSVKHFAANNQETDRLRVSADVSMRALREIYLPAFERVVTASQPWTIMCSYNKINGVSSSENTWLLTDVLRDEWGFRGLVVSDWGAVYHRVPAAKAGLDLEMPPTAGSPAELVDAVRSGELDEQVVTDRARAVLTLVAKGSHVLELHETADLDAHHALAREAAATSVVLLKNDDNILPLATDRRLAVIGEFARTPRFQGAGSSQVNPTRIDTALDALTAAFPEVTFAAGFGVDDPAHDDVLADEAVTAASAADVVVAFLGLPGSYESEGFDRTHMRLPESQLGLLARLRAANPHLVVVLANGSTIELGQVTPHVKGLVEAWLGGQASGSAVVDVLIGAVNPSGHLAETFPLRLEDNPSHLNFPGDSGHVSYGEGLYIGYRGYDKAARGVAFPFGYGMSYTTFDYDDLQVSVTGSVADGTLAATVSVAVTNTGDAAGADVVQIYVRDPESTAGRPVRELKGFARVDLQPGASETATVRLDQRAFSYWSDLLDRWVVEAGEFVIEAAYDSRTIAASTSITIDAPPVAAPLSAESTLQEWLADPRGGEILRSGRHGTVAILADPEMVAVIGNFPMSALASFGMSLDKAQLAAALAEVSQQ
ncbi:MAG: glycoside hydrolase family 3 C-terminal domain-containing protein [Propionibacterium sp.]|nr:glycoside hydrolase family 3 C-terminal domain-containing protein [Propionibacterium sp.]